LGTVSERIASGGTAMTVAMIWRKPPHRCLSPRLQRRNVCHRSFNESLNLPA
jgi:hypothetical protein